MELQLRNTQNEANVLQQFSHCLTEVINWMTSFKLKVKNAKTEIIMYGTSQQLSKVNISNINVGGCEVKCVDQVRDLGFLMNSKLNSDHQFSKNSKLPISSFEI